MNVRVEKSFLSGQLRVPSSKSVMIRALVAAMLARGRSVLHYPSYCDDAMAVKEAIERLGAKVFTGDDAWIIDGGFNPGGKVIDVHESGLAARMFVALGALGQAETVITGRGSLMKRPLGPVEQPLKQLGAQVRTNGGYVPVSVKGPVKGGNVNVDASKSSQFLSGLLMTLPLAPDDSTVYVTSLASKPYVELTLKVLERFGIEIGVNDEFNTFFIKGKQQYKAASVEIEGDWSAAAFWIVAAAINGQVRLNGLDLNSFQADRKILDLIKDLGFNHRTGENYIEVLHSELKAFRFDITHCPDLAPPLVALAAYSPGKSVLYGTKRLTHKESNRAEALRQEARKLGIKIDLFDNKMVIHGGKVIGGTINSHSDHRIAMFGAVMALKAQKPVIITGAESVAKSYPDFFRDLKKLGGTVYE